MDDFDQSVPEDATEPVWIDGWCVHGTAQETKAQPPHATASVSLAPPGDGLDPWDYVAVDGSELLVGVETEELSVPMTVVAEVLRRAGWTLTPPKDGVP